MQVCDGIEFLKVLSSLFITALMLPVLIPDMQGDIKQLRRQKRIPLLQELMAGCLAEARAGIDAEFHPTQEQLDLVGCSMKAKRTRLN